MSDPNIRLLLHRIWQTWEGSGHKDDRPQSFVFMPSRNPVQEALLARWGITVLTPQNEDRIDNALVDFLSDIQERMLVRAAARAGDRQALSKQSAGSS
jgi:hypothetical protein